jgi:SAM-dependent methyltransferase
MIRTIGLIIAFVLSAGPLPASGEAPDYESRKPSRDGIGKVYMGREISHVMGHQGAEWLERRMREAEERTDLLIEKLALTPTQVVADIGAGTGYFSFRMAERLPRGRVLAVDIQPEMLAIIERRAAGSVSNVETVLGSEKSVNLPARTVDLILLVDAYHEFAFPREMGQSMVSALKPGGQLALVEYRAEDPTVPIKRLHKMSQAQAKREMAALGLKWDRTDAGLPQQHLMFFVKPASE